MRYDAGLFECKSKRSSIMNQCQCGSYQNQHGRDLGVDLDLCDVCYWRKRANNLKSFIDKARSESELYHKNGENFLLIQYWFSKDIDRN